MEIGGKENSCCDSVCTYQRQREELLDWIYDDCLCSGEKWPIFIDEGGTVLDPTNETGLHRSQHLHIHSRNHWNHRPSTIHMPQTPLILVFLLLTLFFLFSFFFLFPPFFPFFFFFFSFQNPKLHSPRGLKERNPDVLKKAGSALWNVPINRQTEPSKQLVDCIPYHHSARRNKSAGIG